MLGRRTQYFNTSFQRHIAQACSFSSSQVTVERNLAIYSSFFKYWKAMILVFAISNRLIFSKFSLLHFHHSFFQTN